MHGETSSELMYQTPEGSGGDNSSDDGHQIERGDSRSKSERQRRQLLDRMRREKDRIERSLESQDRRSQEELEAEILKNHTRLKQRRVSTQLKYDYLEKKLGGQEPSLEKKSSGGFLRPSKSSKSEKSPRNTNSMYENDEHIRKQMDELRARLDSLDKGLIETNIRRDGRNLLAPYKIHADSSLSTSLQGTDSLTHQKLRGLESIIKTLDNQIAYASHNNNIKFTRPHSEAVNGDIDSNLRTDDTSFLRDGNSHLNSMHSADTTPTIRAETLALINEFEVMTKELLSRKSSINYQPN